MHGDSAVRGQCPGLGALRAPAHMAQELKDRIRPCMGSTGSVGAFLLRSRGACRRNVCKASDLFIDAPVNFGIAAYALRALLVRVSTCMDTPDAS